MMVITIMLKIVISSRLIKIREGTEIMSELDFKSAHCTILYKNITWPRWRLWAVFEAQLNHISSLSFRLFNARSLNFSFDRCTDILKMLIFEYPLLFLDFFRQITRSCIKSLALLLKILAKKKLKTSITLLWELLQNKECFKVQTSGAQHV